MSITKGLYEKRANLKWQMENAMKEYVDKNVDIPDEKMSEFNKWNAEFDKLTEQIKTLEAADAKLASITESIGKGKETVSKAERDIQEMKDFEDCVRFGFKNLSQERQAEIRANQFYVAGGSKGGYTIPTLVGDKIAAAQKYVGGMVEPGLCRWFNSSTGATINFAKVDDTAQNAYVIAEKTAQTTSSVDMTFTQATLTFYKITSGLVKVGSELLQDSAFDFAGWLTEMLFKRMYRGLNYYFTRGTGNAMPYGLEAISYKGEDAAIRTLARSDIVNLLYSVNKAYQTNGAFMFNNVVCRDLRLLYITNTDFPLWQIAMKDGEPDKLEGKPFYINDDCRSPHPTYRSVFFGDFQQYYIGECQPMKIIRVDELYADTDEVGFVVHGRWAANLVAADYPIKHIRHVKT